MRRFIEIGLFVTIIFIASAFNSFGQCAGKLSFPLKIDELISSSGKNADCRKFSFAETTGDLLGLGKVQASEDLASSSRPDGLMVVGKPSLVIARSAQWVKGTDGTDTFDFGDVYGVLELSCAGAKSPLLSWGPTRFYYSAPYQESETLIEVNALRTGGYNEADQASYTVKGENAAASVGGSSVFPITEAVGCLDLDDRKNSTVKKNIITETRQIPPSFTLIGPVKDTETGEELDREKLPVNRDLTLCMGINVHPAGNEEYKIILKDGESEKILKIVRVKGHHESDNSPASQNIPIDYIPDGSGWTTCFKDLRLAKPQLYSMEIRWLPYDLGSNLLSLRGVKE